MHFRRRILSNAQTKSQLTERYGLRAAPDRAPARAASSRAPPDRAIDPLGREPGATVRGYETTFLPRMLACV